MKGILESIGDNLMFALKKDKLIQTAVCVNDRGYSFVTLKDNKTVMLHYHHQFTDKTKKQLARQLANDIERLNLIGERCRLILLPNQYQLLSMDAADVPDDELAKALKWRLKGLVDYPLNDLAVDAFLVPPHGPAGQRKKAFVAATSLSALNKSIALFESAYVDIVEVGIAELALRNICSTIPTQQKNPIIVISLEGEVCQLHLLYQGKLYLARVLPLTQKMANDNTFQAQNMVLEVQRSIDYCLSELKISEPREIILTPSFYQATALLEHLRETLNKEIKLLDLCDHFSMDSALSPEDQQNVLFSLGGAMTLAAKENEPSGTDSGVGDEATGS